MRKGSQYCVLLLLIPMRYLSANGEKVCSSFCNVVGMSDATPGKSCNDIYQNNKATRGMSKNYWIQHLDTGMAQQVYCDMELECGGHKGGWMRVTQLDTANGDTCPDGWVNNVNYNSLCTGGDAAGCYSANFSVPYSYNKICGQVRGFQKGSTDAFYPHAYAKGLIPEGDYYLPELNVSKTINGVYVDGVSITLGDPRKHVWTYAAGLSDDYDYQYYNCPCASNSSLQAPVFVGNDYYCESGNTGIFDSFMLYSEDALWDGNQCLPDNSCCDRTGQPWFFRQLPINVKEHLEVRICYDQSLTDEVSAVQKLQLFIH